MHHRDNHLSQEQIMQGIQEAWHQRVTKSFGLTEEDCEELVSRAPAELILSAMKPAANKLRKWHPELFRMPVPVLMEVEQDEIVEMFTQCVREEVSIALYRKSTQRTPEESHAAY